MKLGIAHEKGNYLTFKKGKLEDGEHPDSMSSVMDMMNNKKGIETGMILKTEKPMNDREALIRKMIAVLKKGQAFILLKDMGNHFLTCNHDMIDSRLYQEKWNIPKCLVKSDVLE